MITRKRRLRLALALAFAPLTVFLASCSDSEDPTSGVPTPSAVPAGAVAVVGDTQITETEYREALKAALTGYDPLSPTRVAPEPLDPPGYGRCIQAIRQRANGDPDLAGLGRAEFLDSCRQRYDQARALTLSSLIEDRWAVIEAELEGIEIQPAEAEAFVSQIENSWATSPARSRALFRKALAESGLSRADLRDEARAAVARQRLASIESGEAQDPKALIEAERERFDAWRSKTLCAEELIVPQCSNAPEPEA